MRRAGPSAQGLAFGAAAAARTKAAPGHRRPFARPQAPTPTGAYPERPNRGGKKSETRGVGRFRPRIDPGARHHCEYGTARVPKGQSPKTESAAARPMLLIARNDTISARRLGHDGLGREVGVGGGRRAGSIQVVPYERPTFDEAPPQQSRRTSVPLAIGGRSGLTHRRKKGHGDGDAVERKRHIVGRESTAKV